MVLAVLQMPNHQALLVAHRDEERAELGRRHAHTAQQLRNLYCAEYAHSPYKTSSNFSLRMDVEKGVTVA